MSCVEDIEDDCIAENSSGEHKQAAVTHRFRRDIEN